MASWRDHDEGSFPGGWLARAKVVSQLIAVHAET